MPSRLPKPAGPDIRARLVLAGRLNWNGEAQGPERPDMKPPSLALSKRTILSGIAVLALILAGILAWQHERTMVRADDVAAFLNRTVAGGRVRFSVTEIETLAQNEANLQMTVTATARTPVALYSKIDASDYLRRTFQLDPGLTAAARRLLADPDRAQNLELKGAAPFPLDPYQATILQLTSPANAAFSFQGIIDAHHDDNAWSFSLVSGGLVGGGPQGEARSTFGDASLVAGDAGDDTRLRTLVTELQAFASRVAEIRRNSESAHAAVLESRREALLAQIAPGHFFHGQALEAGQQQGTPLYLEITEVSPGKQVTALLRNEGSWRIARVFQGTWNTDDELENPVLNLASLPGQAIRNAGPFLENAQTWMFALHLDAQGGLSERNRFYQYRFDPLAPEQVSALKGRLEAEFDRAIAATKPGLLYYGAVVSRTSGASEPILLRFTGQSAGGETLEAKIESTTHSWKRSLHGTIVTNARRSGGEPIRLRTSSTEAIGDAPVGSVLGAQDDLELHLGPGPGSLAGGDEQFTYRLAIAGETDLRRLDVDRAERVRRFRTILRDGILYDGRLREEQGFVTHARLEITHLDRQTGAITARIHSLVQWKVYQDFVGTCDPAGGAIVLNGTGQGVFDTGDEFDVPFLKRPAATTLRLALTGNSIIGRIEGNPQWTMEFPADAFLAAPTESPEPNSPPVEGSVFPLFPKKNGAYLLSQGSWVPLPANHGHVTVEKVKSAEGAERIPTSILGLVVDGVDLLKKEKGKGKGTVSYLDFDGKDPRPSATGPAIVVLFVGAEASSAPEVELEPAEILKEGQRRVEIKEGPPAPIRFAGLSLAAYVRKIAPGLVLFTTTSPTLPPGPYVFNADGGYELTVE